MSEQADIDANQAEIIHENQPAEESPHQEHAHHEEPHEANNHSQEHENQEVITLQDAVVNEHESPEHHHEEQEHHEEHQPHIEEHQPHIEEPIKEIAKEIASNPVHQHEPVMLKENKVSAPQPTVTDEDVILEVKPEIKEKPQPKEEQKSNPQPVIEQPVSPTADDEIKNKQILIDGYVFLKYGSWGDPGYRIVNLSPDLKQIRWFHSGDTKSSGTMSLDSLLGVKFGRHTPNFKRKPSKNPEQEALSFSIIGEKRNLDLEASQKEQMDLFIEGLVSVMKWLKKKKKDEEAAKKKK